MMVAGASDAAALKLDKATEFLLMAEFALEGECFDAAASLAVSAAINGGDALCLARLGVLPNGQNHDEATRILRGAGFDQASVLLGRTLAIKYKAQYSASRCSRRDAESAVKRAQRMIMTVRASVNRSRG
jgi:hypothetical protein